MTTSDLPDLKTLLDNIKFRYKTTGKWKFRQDLVTPCIKCHMDISQGGYYVFGEGCLCRRCYGLLAEIQQKAKVMMDD